MLQTGRYKGTVEAVATIVLDIVLLIAVFKLAVIIRSDILSLMHGAYQIPLRSSGPLKHWWVLLVFLFFFAYEGLYVNKVPFWDEVRAAGKASFFAAVGVLVIVSLGKLSGEVSRTVIVLMGGIAIFVMPFVRAWGKGLMRRFGLFRRRVLILGAGKTGRLILKALRKETNLGFEVVGFLDDDPAKAGTRPEGIKVHRGIDNAVRYIKRARISDVVIAMPGAGKERIQGLINALQHEARRIMLVPDIFGMAVLGTKLQHFFEEQAFALEIQNNLARPLNYYTKRVFEFIAGSVLLLLFSVPLVIIGILVKATSPGPALFGQKRMGRNGRLFMCFKYRSMYVDAEERLQRILAEDGDAKEEYETYWKLKDDPRVTPIGRFLRRTSLDELPQLINVIRGEMSLVGPRPYLPREEKYIAEYSSTIYSVLPGITGLWQVSGRSDTGYDYRIALDAWYVRNWNLWLDVVILIKTFRAVFRAEGAR